MTLHMVFWKTIISINAVVTVVIIIMTIPRSTPIACYTFWKAMEVLLGHLTASGVLPSLPMATELVM